MLALSLFLSCVPGLDAEALEKSGKSGRISGGTTTEAFTFDFSRLTTEATTEAPTEVTTEATTMAPTEAPTKAATVAPTEATTETATESGTDGDSTGDNDAAAEAAMDQSSLLPNYSVTPNTDVPAYEAYKGMREWNNGTVTEALPNTYSLTIATGESAGDAVLYFVVRYKDIYGVTKSQFVFPGVDGGARSDSILRYKAGNNLDNAYGSRIVGNYKYAEKSAKESPLDSWTVQDYIFTTESTIASIEKVEVYLSTGTTGTSSSLDSENSTLSSDGDNHSKETVNDSNTRFVTNNKQTADKDTGDNVIRKIEVSDTNGVIKTDEDTEGAVKVIPNDTTLRFSANTGSVNSSKKVNTKNPDVKYRYDIFNQDFIEDDNGLFKYDSELKTYYEINSPNLYFYPQGMEFVLKDKYVWWKERIDKGSSVSITTEPTNEKDKWKFDETSFMFYRDNSGDISYSYDKDTFYKKDAETGETLYYDFNEKKWTTENDLTKQIRYDGYGYKPEFKKGTKYYYDIYTRRFKEDANGKYVYDPVYCTVYNTDSKIYYDIGTSEFKEKDKIDFVFSYNAFDQSFYLDPKGKLKYSDSLETYYYPSYPNLYFCPGILQFVSSSQFKTWKSSGSVSPVMPQNKNRYNVDETTGSIFQNEQKSGGAYDSNKGTFYIESKNQYYDFNERKWVKESELTKQVRFSDYNPEFKEDTNYYYNVYTCRFEEDPKGKFIYDPVEGTVYHTEDDVYYDITKRTFVEKDNIYKRYRYDDFDQNFILDNSGHFIYDKDLDTYYSENNKLYFYPEKYEFITKEKYTAWKNNAVEPDTLPNENKQYSYDSQTSTFFEVEYGMVHYDKKKKTFHTFCYNDDWTDTYTGYFDFNSRQYVKEDVLPEQVRYKQKPKPEYKEGVNYYFDVYTRTFKENTDGKFVYDPKSGTVYHTVKNVYYDINTDKFVPKDKLSNQDDYSYNEEFERNESFYTGNAVPQSELSHKKSVTTNNEGIIGTNTKTSSKGTWTIQGLSIYKVNKYKSYEEYGLVSGQKFLDFEGYMIADVKKRGGGTLTFSTSGVDTVITIGGAEDSNYCDIVNYGAVEVKRSFASDSSLYSIRMDMADQLNAGIEAFTNSDGTKISGDNGIVEDIAIEMQYKDTHGWTRKVTVPFILSSYMAASKACGDDTILGFAGRGDTVAMQGLFPEFDRLAASPKIYVGNTARTKVSEKGINVSKATTKMNTAITATASDDISLAGVSMYKGGCMPYVTGGTDSDGRPLTGATLQYVFESADPFQYYTTTDTKGRMVKANGNDTIKLVAYKSGSPLVASVFGRDRYLVTLKTSDKKRSGTKDDISLMFYYEKQDGSSASTISYRVKQGANDFLGAWPTKAGGNYLETAGLADGGDISFLIEAPDLKTFTGVDISLLGDDEWVMDNLIIALVDDVQLRRAYIKKDNSTNYWVERQMTIAPIFSLKGLDAYVQDDDGNALDEDGRQVEKKKEQKYDDDGNPIREYPEGMFDAPSDTIPDAPQSDVQTVNTSTELPNADYYDRLYFILLSCYAAIEDYTNAHKFGGLLKHSEKMAVKYSDVIIGDNKGITNYVHTEYEKIVANKKVELIAYGGNQVLHIQDDSLYEKYPFCRKTYACTVCRIEPENNVHVILEAFAQIPKKQLVIVGNWAKSEYGKHLKEKYGAYENIHLLDPIYEPHTINWIRSNVALYLHGHSAGGTNPSLVEAMCLGLPILAFDCVYNRATTEDKAMFWKNATDIIAMITSEIDRKKLSEEMEKIGKKNYSWESIAEKYNALY